MAIIGNTPTVYNLKEKQDELASKIEELEFLLTNNPSRDLTELKNDVEKDTQKKECWSWNKFVIGLSRYGITESVILSTILLAMASLIEYLEIVNLGENSGYIIFSGFLVTVLKSFKQILKNDQKNN